MQGSRSGHGLPALASEQLAARTPDAVVVGACAHGLAITRALWRGGARVLVLEQDASLPGTSTWRATVRRVPGINGAALIDSLVQLARELPAQVRPPLFLTNDRMIDAVATHAELIARSYRVSWLESAPAIVPLLSKSRLETRCRIVEMNYPRTAYLDDSISQALMTLRDFRFPVILKPDKPLSPFKTLVVDSADRLADALRRVQSSFPVIAQEYIAGDESNIHFGVLYLQNGAPQAHFEGRKLRSRPMGHTTVAVSAPDDAVHELALRFFEGLGISGPVSLELKRDPDGRYWVIEPTVGRSDFWVDLCIANGVNLALTEYCALANIAAPASAQTDRYLWINGERDPFALAWLLWNHPAELWRRRIRGVYFSLADPMPYLSALFRRFARMPGRAWRKLRRSLA